MPVPSLRILVSNVQQKSMLLQQRGENVLKKNIVAHTLPLFFVSIDVSCHVRSIRGIEMTKTGMVLCVGGELVLLDPGESTYFISTICLDFYRYSQISSFFFDIDGGKNH